MGDRDPATYHEASHWPDVADGCDTLSAHIAELVAEEWPRRADERAKPAVIALITRVVERLLAEGRLAPVVDVKRLPGKELLAQLLDEIINAPDAVLMAYCIDFVMETGVNLGMTMTKIGKHLNVTKSTVSHHCRYLTVTYRGSKPAAGMKSIEAVSSYRRVRTGKSSRGPRIEWQFAETFAKNYERNVSSTHSGPN